MLYSKRRKNLGGGRKKRSNRKSYGSKRFCRSKKGGSPDPETIKTLFIEYEHKELKSIASEIYWLNIDITSSTELVQLYDKEIKLWNQILSNQKLIISLLQAEKDRILRNDAVEVKYTPELQELIAENLSILTTIDKKLKSDKEEREEKSVRLHARSDADIEDILHRLQQTLDRNQVVQELFDLRVKNDELNTTINDLYYTTIHELKWLIKMNDDRIDILKSDCDSWVEQHIKLIDQGLLPKP